jgi:hypothetical protein
VVLLIMTMFTLFYLESVNAFVEVVLFATRSPLATPF